MTVHLNSLEIPDSSRIEAYLIFKEKLYGCQ